MLFTLLCGAVLVTGFLLHRWWREKMTYWERQGVHYVPGSFPFGNIKDILLMRKTIGDAYDEIYWELKDRPFGGIFRFWYPAVFVRDPEVIKTIFVRDFTSFHDNEYYVDPYTEPLLAINPFNAKGERWTKSRSVVTQSLSLAKIKSMIPQVHRVCHNLVAHVAKIPDGTATETGDLMGKYATDVVICSAYGFESDSFSDAECSWRSISQRVLNGNSFLSNIATLCAFYAPNLGRLFKFKIIPSDVSKEFIELVDTAVKYRLENDLSRDDFLQSLVNTNKEALAQGKPPVYSPLEMAGHSMTFFLDGYKTVEILLAFLLFELSHNQDVQNHLRKEIVKEGSKLEDFDFEKVHKIHYLDLVVKEALRRNTPGTSMARTCTRDTVLRSGDEEVQVKTGMAVILPMYSIQNDPLYFPQPDRFDPLRFDKDRDRDCPEFSYFPFGGGPRSCPGTKFSMTVVKIATIGLMLNFKILPNETPAPKIVADPLNTFFRTSKNGLWVKFDNLNK